MSNVYYTNLRSRPGRSLPKKMELLVKAAGIGDLPCKDKFTAIKIHFGELGNMAFLRHNYAARMAELLKNMGARPFLTDTNTLYSGSRSNAVDHLHTAFLNGYNAISVPHAPVIIADGLKGTDEVVIPLPEGEYCKEARIASAIAGADVLVSMTHFKGHEQAGFGGALKNVGMGGASVGGKLHMHSDSQPVIARENCIGCNVCVANCRHKAVTLDAERKAVIDYEICVGCGQCIAVCQYDAARPGKYSSTQELTAKIAEYALAVLRDKPHFHVAFIMDVSPHCDCWSMNDVPIVPDIGMLASFDPLALDQACFDLVRKAPAMPDSMANPEGKETLEGADKFTCVHPRTDGVFGLAHAEKMKLGSRTYTLIEV
ncbi:MAG: DUF362 domain-containing protein [Bacteroidales bacterium]